MLEVTACPYLLIVIDGKTEGLNNKDPIVPRSYSSSAIGSLLNRLYLFSLLVLGPIREQR